MKTSFKNMKVKYIAPAALAILGTGTAYAYAYDSDSDSTRCNEPPPLCAPTTTPPSTTSNNNVATGVGIAHSDSSLNSDIKNTVQTTASNQNNIKNTQGQEQSLNSTNNNNSAGGAASIIDKRRTSYSSKSGAAQNLSRSINFSNAVKGCYKKKDNHISVGAVFAGYLSGGSTSEKNTDILVHGKDKDGNGVTYRPDQVYGFAPQKLHNFTYGLSSGDQTALSCTFKLINEREDRQEHELKTMKKASKYERAAIKQTYDGEQDLILTRRAPDCLATQAASAMFNKRYNINTSATCDLTKQANQAVANDHALYKQAQKDYVISASKHGKATMKIPAGYNLDYKVK